MNRLSTGNDSGTCQKVHTFVALRVLIDVLAFLHFGWFLLLRARLLSISNQAAKKQKKWLLVNIQAKDKFNRPNPANSLWNDKTVKSMVADKFIFWEVNVG